MRNEKCWINNRLLFLVLPALLLLGCKNESIVYFYSLDKSQCITVISEYHYRYVVDGRHDSLPDTNFVKLRVKDRDTMWDAFYVRWGSGNYKWYVIVPHSEVLESKLDTAMFEFDTELPKDERGIPTEREFRENNCAIYDFELKRLTPDQGAIVEYK